MYRKALLSLATTSVLALAAPALAQQVPAAPAPGPTGSGAASTTQDDLTMQDIVVTAQRRSQRLQDVPIAISAVDGETLSDRNIVGLASLRAVAPGLSATGNAGVAAGAIFALRGVSGQALPIGAGQATAVYLDGVYLPRADAALFTLYDVERIEVLRGPQGTLYGRNATAGAINIITEEPGKTVKAGFDVNYGNFDSVRARAKLSGPLGGGFAAGVSGSYSTRDGYYFNTVTNARVEGRTDYTVRGKLRYASPDDSFSASLSGDYSETKGAEFTKTILSPTGAYVGIGDPKVLGSNTGNDTLLSVKSYGGSFVMNYDAGSAVTLTSVTGYRNVKNVSLYDGDGSAVPILRTGGSSSAESFSQEVRGLVTLTNFRATLGVNYYHENGSFGLSTTPQTLPVSFTSPLDQSTFDIYAAFGQIEFDLAKGLTLVGGLRYNYEKRDFSIDYRRAFPVAGLFTVGKVSDKTVLPSVGINYEPSDDILLYAKASEGYQAPGFNFAPGPFAPANTFQPETLWAYEVGAKTQFLDRRVTLNVAAFYYDYKDIQVRSVIAPGVTIVNNAASAKVKGAEAELTVRPFPGLTLSGNVTYVDAKFGRFCETISAGSPIANDPLCVGTTQADRSGNRLAYAPEWSGGVSATYTTKIGGDMSLNAFAGYSFESNQFNTTANEAIIATGGFEKLDARLGLEFGPAEIYVFGNNLTNERYPTNVGRFAATIAYGAINDPRLYGVGFRYRF